MRSSSGAARAGRSRLALRCVGSADDGPVGSVRAWAR